MKYGDIVNNPKPHNFKDLTGKQFGRLTVLRHVGSEVCEVSPKIKFKSVWEVLCSCGKEKIVRGSDLGKKTVSCGCFSSERTIEFNKATKTKESYCAFSDVYTSYRVGAKSRNILFNLSKSEFLDITKKECYYCGLLPRQTRKSRTKGQIPSYVYNGIDRVDNDIGYQLDNVVPCCKMCNRMKLDTPIDIWFNKMRSIIDRFNVDGTKK